MADPQYELGMVGLGVMGRNFLLNLADHGYAVAGFDKDPEKVDALRAEGAGRPVGAAEDMASLVAMLRRPRVVMMLVPAGKPVDAVIGDLLGHLEPGDLIVDGGNSHFPDTEVRARRLEQDGIAYLGVGISGGESGARHGPSIMPGGPRDAYQRIAPMLEAAAAHVDGDPCVSYLGPGSAGHYVKMVHNGIEYGLMQLIAETYDVMKRGLGLGDERMGAVFDEWNRHELAGYLVEITGCIFEREDARTDKHLIDVIRDEARQKGTGMWTCQDAMELQVPTPTIDVAVAMRNLSALKDQREAAASALPGPGGPCEGDAGETVEQLHEALYASTIVTFAQGMAQLGRASDQRQYGLDLEAVARIWRGGCIIRAALLEQIRAAYRARADLPNLLLDARLGQAVADRQEAWRAVVRKATQVGIPVPAMAVSLAYFDALRSRWLPANLVEAQRDYFGAHTYERIDAKGVFHTRWAEPPQGDAHVPAAATGGGST